MNLVVITSVLRPINDKTIFTVEQRIAQTTRTIQTIKANIPNYHIVLAEGGVITERERTYFQGLINHVYENNITEFKKSPGEGNLLYRFMTSDYFKSLTHILTLSKISGRYWLDDNFRWDALPMDKLIFNHIAKGWLGKPLYNTRYYRMPRFFIPYYIEGLERYINSQEAVDAWPDLEHCFYTYVILAHDLVYSPSVLGVSGLVTGNAKPVSD